MKCELCKKYEWFRTYKDLKMCIICYQLNFSGIPFSTETKATDWDRENLVYKKL